MSANTVENPSSGSSFGSWIVPAFLMAFLAVCSGIIFSYGIFLPSIVKQFDVDIEGISANFSLFMIVAAVSGYMTLVLRNRIAARIIVPVMGILAGTGLLLASMSDSFWHYVVAYGILLASGVGSILAIITYLFIHMLSRSHAILLIIIGICIGMMVIIPICGWLVSSYSWEDAYLFLSIVAWIVFIPLGFFITDSKTMSPVIHHNHANSESMDDMSTVIGSRNFWLSFGTWLFLSFAVHLILIHLISHAVLNSISLQRASYLSIMFGAVGIVSAAGISSTNDKIDRKSISIIVSLIAAIVTFWIIDAEQMWRYSVYVILFAPAFGSIGYFSLSFVSHYMYSTTNDNKLYIIIIGWIVGAAVGVYLGGYLFEIVGDYRFSLFIGAWALVLAGACIWHLDMTEQKTVPSMKQKYQQSD